VVAIEVENSVLKFSVFGHTQLFDDFCSRSLGVRVMLLHIVSKDSQALRSVAELSGSPLVAARAP
jgi:hypothetical protein